MPHPPSALRASRAIERIGRLLREDEAAAGLPPAQWEALRCLAAVNSFSRTPSGVAVWLATTRGTASQTLISLERKGYVTRTKSPRDGRGAHLQLTDKGLELLARDPLAKVMATIASLPPLHVVALGQSLAQILDALQADDRKSPFLGCAGCAAFGPEPGDNHCAHFGAHVETDDQARMCVGYQAPVSDGG